MVDVNQPGFLKIKRDLHLDTWIKVSVPTMGFKADVLHTHYNTHESPLFRQKNLESALVQNQKATVCVKVSRQL